MHLTTEQIERLRSRRANGSELFAAHAHLAECESCRIASIDDARVLALRDSLREEANPSRWPWWLAAAAALAIVATLGVMRRPDPYLRYDLRLPPIASELAATAHAMRGTRLGASTLEPLEPVGSVVVSGSPRFAWTPVPGARYRVEVFDASFRPVASSPWLTTHVWTAALPEGRTYTWQVTAQRDDAVATAPQPPAPEARFHVADPAAIAKIARLEAEARPNIELAIAYAEAGAWPEAERELTRLVAAGEHAEAAARLLRIVQAHAS
ncbi:MAG TPA: hypothetical protein VF824_16045 [Thermoanaerobaculia bacterium]|jgi:hypothetical protein